MSVVEEGGRREATKLLEQGTPFAFVAKFWLGPQAQHYGWLNVTDTFGPKSNDRHSPESPPNKLAQVGTNLCTNCRVR